VPDFGDFMDILSLADLWPTSSNRSKTAPTENQASNPESKNRDRSLEDIVARQALVIQTLVTICEEKGVFSRSDFLQLMEKIDMLDGKRDGKLAPPKGRRACEGCGKPNTTTALKCMYCGHEMPHTVLGS